jgi:hypothetical protein
MTSKSVFNQWPARLFSLVVIWGHIRIVQCMLMASPTLENLWCSCNQFWTHSTSDWHPGMLWHSPYLHNRPLTQLLHHFETAIIVLCRQLLPHIDYLLNLGPLGLCCHVCCSDPNEDTSKNIHEHNFLIHPRILQYWYENFKYQNSELCVNLSVKLRWLDPVQCFQGFAY